MPTNYQPPKLHQFDGKGNPRQHIAHFVETCSNAGRHGELWVKQFARSLRGNAFDWYIDLEPESIDSWEKLEKEFLNRFYSTRRTVSMIELTGTKQRKDEHVVDYINRWRELSLDYKYRLSEISAMEICIQLMHWGLSYILRGIKPRTFEELATRAHDMELSIASHGKASPFDDQKEFKKNVPLKNQTKESMEVKVTSVKVTTKQKVKEDKTPSQYPKEEKRRPTLKELEAKIYPFPNSDVPTILDELLDKKVIDLLESKRPEEIGKVGDPKYCKFHRVISHPTEKCFVLKEKIMVLVSEGKIIIDMDKIAKANHATIALNEKKCSKLHNVSSTTFLQFGSFDPIEVDLPRKTLEGSLELDNHSKDKDDEDGAKKLGIYIDELSKSNLTIQGFNQGGQRTIGMIRIGLSIGEMNSNTLIHVIDAKTSYNLLLGCPWIHENGVVSSTLHQCLKYRRDGEIVKIDADIKPFTETESYFADAKFYLDSCEPKVEKPSSDDEANVKSEEENEAQWTSTKLPKKGAEEVSIKISSSEGDIQTKTEEYLVFRYVPRECRKKGQPFL
ncbi:uncharacterized protein LOC142181985 [Nicotiana tabacum]|uniref:Uncharacterized protein LOC142181985 n=1 Tax=Nicotiana tabacum TaxID=4097 RepID=A0AC58UQR5_TOBAC